MAEENRFNKEPPYRFTEIKSLSKKEAAEEAEQLIDTIVHHNYLYYVKNSPEISDDQYDILFRRLQELEEEYPDLKSDSSPTRRVGAPPVDELKKVEHTVPMLSLNSVLEESKIKDFYDFVNRNVKNGDVLYVAEPKLDGLSVESVYRNGVFQRGSTRGDGYNGEDISVNLKTIKSLPLRLQKDKDLPLFLSVRGEALLSSDGFQKCNKQRIEQGKEPFANPRNAASGMLHQLDSRKLAGIPLEIYFYDILKCENKDMASQVDGFHWESLKLLSKWGFRTNPLNRRCSSLKEILDYRLDLADKRDGLDYEIDGIVIKIDNIGQREKLGTRERSPRWAIAWKFPPKKETTILRDIVVQVGRTGRLTPVALLEPVSVGGVTVSRATLHNEDEVKRKDVRPGDRVKVMRAGDVIPEVAERIPQRGKKRGGPFSMPNKCPVCGSKVERDGAYIFCPAGLSCPAQLVGRIAHYASRSAMNIHGLGDEIAQTLVDQDMVKDITDLYTLSVEDLKVLEGFVDSAAKKLHRAIQGSSNPKLARFLYALGIRHVGKHIARVLAGHFGSLKALQNAQRNEIENIQEVGPQIAESVYSFFHEGQNVRVIKRLREQGVSIKREKKKERLPLSGKRFVFTGELDNYTREEAQELVESLGGRATSSVSSKSDYIIAGEDPGTKLDKAKKRGIKIIDEKEFEKLVK
jgi:DNA ligase (NAD+)